MEWTVESPTVLEIAEPVRSLAVRLVGGGIDVVATDDSEGARVEVTEVDGEPLYVANVAGELVVRHDQLSWDGILGWLRPQRARAVVSVAVPRSCSTRIGVVSAGAVVAGLAAATEVRTVSGDVVLDATSGNTRVDAVSAEVESRAASGELIITTVSGVVTLVDTAAARVRTKTVSGDVAVDVDAGGVADVDVTTVTGDVTIALPETVGARVDVQTVSGDLTCDHAGLRLDRRPGRRALSGSIGDSAGRLRARTVSGDVAVLVAEHV